MLVPRLVSDFDALVPSEAATLTAVGNSTVPQGATFRIAGMRFTPTLGVRLFTKPPGTTATWSTMDNLVANGTGSLDYAYTVPCQAAVGTWSIQARDEGPWIQGDFNGDGIVNSVDWSIMNTKWFTADAFLDINRDGLVNSIDFSILNLNWFKTGRSGRVSPAIQFNVTAAQSCGP